MDANKASAVSLNEAGSMREDILMESNVKGASLDKSGRNQA